MTFTKSRFEKKIPIAPQPKAGESLGGWYARVSSGFAVNLHDALPVIDLGEIKGNHIDNKTIASLSNKLNIITDISSDVWKRMIEPEAKLTNMWLKFQPKTKYCFPQLPNYYCIECFLEDLETRGGTFYRVEWMSPFVLSCHKHRSPLMNNKLSRFENANCKLDNDKFESRVNYVGHYEIVGRSVTRLNNNYISPMARRVSDLFSLDDKVSKTALKVLGRYDNLATARSAAIAVLQILSFRSWETECQCLGRILFAESNCKEFLEWRGYNRRSLCFMTKDQLITCFEQVGWFICHPSKYKRYGLNSISNFIVSEFKSDGLKDKIKADQLVLLFALLIYYQRYHFIPEVSEYHPLFDDDWKRAARNFFEVVDKRYYE